MSFSIPMLSDLINKGMDSIVKWKESEDKKEISKAEFNAMKEQWKLEMTKYMGDQVGRTDREFREFFLTYEGSGDKVHPVVQFMRGAIRPFITIWVVIIITLFMFNAELTKDVAKNMEAIPQSLWNIFEYVIAFWFGGRAVQHVVSKYSQGKVEEMKAQADAEVAIAEEHTKQAKIEAGVIEEDFSEVEKKRAFPRRPFHPKRRRR